jgi:hypothetical protein
LLALPDALGHGTGLNPRGPVAKQWDIAAALDWNEHVAVKNLLCSGVVAIKRVASRVLQVEVFSASTKFWLLRFPRSLLQKQQSIRRYRNVSHDRIQAVHAFYMFWVHPTKSQRDARETLGN